LLFKLKLATIIQDIIAFRQLTHADAARLMGIDESAAHMIAGGVLKDFSVERLASLIHKLAHSLR
jgi:predicted XRE-type DNA-binding protein